MRSIDRDRGSAVVAAVLVAACFALMAAQLVRASRSEILTVNESVAHAQLSAAAEAGVALAVHGLTETGARGRWEPNRAPHAADIGRLRLQITVEDERGKIPLNTITAAQAAAMFREAGAAPDATLALVAAFVDFRDPRPQTAGRTPTPDGGGAPPPRSGGFETLGEFSQLPGMTPALYAAISPSATVYAGNAAFDASTATPFALKVMQVDASPYAAINRARDLQGERTALDASQPMRLVGRALMVRVRAHNDAGAELQTSTIIELTGLSARPYIVREKLPDFG